MSILKTIRSWFQQPPADFARAHQIAFSNFTYVKQQEEWKRGQKRVLKVHNMLKPFSGDCDDFAATMCAAFPKDAVFTFVWDTPAEKQLHVVCVYKGWVSDNKRKSVYPVYQIRPLSISFPWVDMPEQYKVESV